MNDEPLTRERQIDILLAQNETLRVQLANLRALVAEVIENEMGSNWVRRATAALAESEEEWIWADGTKWCHQCGKYQPADHEPAVTKPEIEKKMRQSELEYQPDADPATGVPYGDLT